MVDVAWTSVVLAGALEVVVIYWFSIVVVDKCSVVVVAASIVVDDVVGASVVIAVVSGVSLPVVVAAASELVVSGVFSGVVTIEPSVVVSVLSMVVVVVVGKEVGIIVTDDVVPAILVVVSNCVVVRTASVVVVPGLAVVVPQGKTGISKVMSPLIVGGLVDCVTGSIVGNCGRGNLISPCLINAGESPLFTETAVTFSVAFGVSDGRLRPTKCSRSNKFCLLILIGIPSTRGRTVAQYAHEIHTTPEMKTAIH